MLSNVLHRLRALFRGKEVDAEMDEELAYHLDREVEKYQRLGFSKKEAARRARIDLSGVEQARQQCREGRGTTDLEILGRDLRYGFRMLRKKPGVTFLILLSLAIGIGANSALFSVTDTLLLKPLPYPHSGRLALLWLRSPGIGIPQDWPSPGQYHDIQTQNHVFDQTAILIDDSFVLGGRRGTPSLRAVNSHCNKSQRHRLIPWRRRSGEAREAAFIPTEKIHVAVNAWSAAGLQAKLPDT